VNPTSRDDVKKLTTNGQQISITEKPRSTQP